MFIVKTEVFNFADDNTIDGCGEGLYNILGIIKHDESFRINSLQANPGKVQFMILGKKKRNSVKLMINSNEIEESKRVVLLGIKIDNPLNFDEHINNLCPSTLITIGREL